MYTYTIVVLFITSPPNYIIIFTTIIMYTYVTSFSERDTFSQIILIKCKSQLIPPFCTKVNKILYLFK